MHVVYVGIAQTDSGKLHSGIDKANYPGARLVAFCLVLGLGTVTFAALITLFGAVLINAFEPYIAFVFFGCFMVLQLLYTHFMMPETKGKSLEELEEELVGK